MSLQISVMLILLAPRFWPEVEYIALLEQMESELHWEMEIGWLPAKSSVLEAEWAGAETSCLESILSAVGKGGETRGRGSEFILRKNMLKRAHQQMFTPHSKSNWIFLSKTGGDLPCHTLWERRKKGKNTEGVKSTVWLTFGMILQASVTLLLIDFYIC